MLLKKWGFKPRVHDVAGNGPCRNATSWNTIQVKIQGLKRVSTTAGSIWQAAPRAADLDRLARRAAHLLQVGRGKRGVFRRLAPGTYIRPLFALT